MEEKIKAVLLEHSILLFGNEISEDLIQFQATRKDVEGDLTLLVFPFVKLLRCYDPKIKPREILYGNLNKLKKINQVFTRKKLKRFKI